MVDSADGLSLAVFAGCPDDTVSVVRVLRKREKKGNEIHGH